MLCSLFMFAGVSVAAPADQDQDLWDEAGQKVKEATEAVGKATGETKDKAVAEAMKTWEEAKEKYRASVAAAKEKYEAEVEAARAKIHAATAPENEDEAAGQAEETDAQKEPGSDGEQAQ